LNVLWFFAQRECPIHFSEFPVPAAFPQRFCNSRQTSVLFRLGAIIFYLRLHDRISSSPGDLQPIFDIMLANATRICDANYCGLFLCHGDAIRLAAQCQIPQALQDYLRRRDLYVPPANSPLGRIIQTKQLLHSLDISAETDTTAPSAVLGGARAYLGIPMLKETELIGIIVVFRQ
jgi:GAF domain